MITTVLAWWVMISYFVGFLIFFLEAPKHLRLGQYRVFAFGIFLLMLSPLTAWHAVLHYAQWAFCKLTKRPVKYWL